MTAGRLEEKDEPKRSLTLSIGCVPSVGRYWLGGRMTHEDWFGIGPDGGRGRRALYWIAYAGHRS